MIRRVLPFVLSAILTVSAATAQDMRSVPPSTIFDWNDRVSVTLRDQGRAAQAAGQPQERLVPPQRATMLETDEEKDSGVEFGGHVYMGIAIPF